MPRAIMVETMPVDELAALDAYRLGLALNEVLAEIGTCLRLTRSIRDRIAQAKIECLRAEPGEDMIAAKERRILAETELQHIRDRASTLRLQSSILQSLLRAANIT